MEENLAAEVIVNVIARLTGYSRAHNRSTLFVFKLSNLWQKCGMPELWTVRYDHWSLPIHVTPNESGMVGVSPAPIPLLPKQRWEIERFLDKNAFSHTEDGWYLDIRMLSQYASPERPGVEAEDCVRWAPPRYKEEIRLNFRDMEGFFESMASAGWFQNPKSAEIVFAAFCRHMMHWLTVRRKSIDLGFCRLVPLPFRANWKEMLLSWQMRPKRGKASVKGLKKTFRDHLLRCNGLLGVRPNSLRTRKAGIVWSLECVPQAWWHKATADIEGARLYRMWRKESTTRVYWLEVGRKMREAEEDARAAYFTYVAQIGAPTVQMVENLLSYNLVPDPQQSKTYYIDCPWPLGNHYQITRGSAKDLNEHAGVTIDFGTPPSNVWPMYGLRSGFAHVRDARDDGQQVPPDRVPVPDGIESPGAGG